MNIEEVIEALREEFKKKVNLKEKWERRISSLGGRMLAIEKFVVEQKGEWKKQEEELKAREREKSTVAKEVIAEELVETAVI